MKRFSSIFVLSLFVASCFGVGAWIGLHPEVFNKYLNLTKSEIVFYLEDPNLLNTELQLQLVNLSHTRILFITENIEKADLALLSGTKLKTLEVPKCPTGVSLAFFQKLEKLISPDFLVQSYNDKKALPGFWRKQDQKITLDFLSLMKCTASNLDKFQNISKVLLSAQFQSLVLKKTARNSTLLTLDESGLDESRKSLYLRKLDLRTIDIE